VFYSTYAAWIESDSDRDTVERIFAKPEPAEAQTGPGLAH